MTTVHFASPWLVLRLLSLLAVCLVLGAAQPAWAFDDLVVKRAVLADPSGTLTIEQVAQREDFRPVSGPVSRGYTAAVTWLRIEVKPTLLGQVALMAQPTYLDDLRLYSPWTRPTLPAGYLFTAWQPDAEVGPADYGAYGANTTDDTTPAWRVQWSGDRVALSGKALKTVNPAFLVASLPDRPTVHYLRLETTSVSLLHVKAFSLPDLMAFDTLFHSVVSAYVGLITILAGFAFVCWRITRDRIWGLDALFQAVTVMFTLSIMGMGGRYWFAEWPEASDLMVSTMTVIHLGVAGLFFWQLFKSYGSPGWTTWIYRGSVLVFPLLLGLIVLGDTRTAVSVNANLILLQTVAGLFIIWFVPIADRIQRWLMRFVYVGLVLYLLFFILPLLGLAKPTEFNLYPALGANLFTGLLMQAVLWRRTHLQIKERTALRLQLAASEQLAKHEAARREDTASFLGMLVHEIKTPLTSIAIASQTLAKGFPDPATAATPQARHLQHIQAAVDGIDAVLERCVDADRLEQGALLIQPEVHDVSQLLADWVSAEPGADRVNLTLPGPLPVRVDAPLLCLMVRNLLSNALKYSPEGSEVTVLLREATGLRVDDALDQPGVLITVANAVGKAGTPDTSRLFQKYYRAPHAHRQTGTGLGLYWVHGVVQLLGGRVAYWHDPQSLQPVVFALWLPLGGSLTNASQPEPLPNPEKPAT